MDFDGHIFSYLQSHATQIDVSGWHSTVEEVLRKIFVEPSLPVNDDVIMTSYIFKALESS